MSLFPAYASQAEALEQTETANDKPEWLENSSFQPELVISKENDLDKPDRTKTHVKKTKRPKREGTWLIIAFKTFKQSSCNFNRKKEQ